MLGRELRLTPALEARSADAFAVPVARFRIHYRPGGYPKQEADAVLRPIAEFTNGLDQSRIDYWLPLEPESEKLDSNYRP